MFVMSLGDIPVHHQGCITPIIQLLLLSLPPLPVLSPNGAHADCIELITSFCESKKVTVISRIASVVSLWKSVMAWEYLGASLLTSSIALLTLSFVSSIDLLIAS